MRAVLGALSLLCLSTLPAHALLDGAGGTRIGRICDLIARHAHQNRLPEAFFARLIWKESGFNAGAVSPAGAEGIAQFMPGTARMRGLADSFDPEQAIPASAAYLREMQLRFGNLGLAAAAYNSGEGRVSRWLGSGGFLPLETENYVLDIMGAPADTFADRTTDKPIERLHDTLSFAAACRALPASRDATPAMASLSLKPWAVQVAGNIRRNVAVRQFERVKRRAGDLIEGHEVAVSRVRSPNGRRGIYVVRVGLETQGEANRLCSRLRGAGLSCIPRRNR